MKTPKKRTRKTSRDILKKLAKQHAAALKRLAKR